MNRVEFEAYVKKTYSVKKDYPWIRYPSFAVYRHKNQKCFAIVMNLSKDKLGLDGDGIIEAVNLKCSPIMIGSLCSENGIFPAYHMNKEHWVTVALNGSVDDDKIKMLVELSFEATAKK